VLAKAKELMILNRIPIFCRAFASALLDAPDARLKNLYRAKKLNIKEMQGKLEPFLNSVPKLMDVNPDASRPDDDLSRVLRAAVQAGRQTSRAATPGDLLLAMMKFAAERRVVKIFEDALGSAEFWKPGSEIPRVLRSAAEEQSQLSFMVASLYRLQKKSS
jgi:ATP-dependent Clp protease ATP-binding subunit ClpB